MAAPIAAAVQQVVESAVSQAGFELFSLTGGGTRNRPLLEVRIDRPDGAKVTIDDCAVVSRAIEAVLDGSVLVAETYRLEVSSPGMDRPLRHAADWRRFAGRRVTVTSGALVGSRVEGLLVGIDEHADVETGVVRDDQGTEHRVALADVKTARLVVTWNR
ncbi:MAG: ribosome maturation factor RimP [Gemmatimonadaceae bacterium]|nr:ribosome maturation factor RimP [Gemmatimonadaceae bacterium]